MASTLPDWALWVQALGPFSLSVVTAGVANRRGGDQLAPMEGCQV